MSIAFVYKLPQQFSASEQHRYDLFVEIFESKKLAGFDRKWHRLFTRDDLGGFKKRSGLTTEKKQSNEDLSRLNSSLGLEIFTFKTPKVDNKGYIIKWEECEARQELIKLSNNVILEMVYIPAGEFLMGAAKGELETTDYEYPQHKVKIPAFYMAKYPVTQEQYQAVMGNNPSMFKGDKRPVELLSWEDAKSFCQKLSLLTQTVYRLPSEAEWEYACRAGTTTPFYVGETITAELANYNGNYCYGNAIKGKYREQTTEVGSFSANPFGLYDMHGNVFEWCEDVWHENYDGAPSDATAWISEGDQTLRVVRFGSWNIYPKYLRSASRYRYALNVGNGGIGFRLSRTI